MATIETLNFIGQIAPLIVAEGKKRGYKIFSTVIAQAIIESNSGKSKLSQPPNYNYFGIKCGSAWLKQGKPYVSMKTKEEYTVGNLTTITDAFRKYSSMADGVSGYYDFISTKRYANLKTATTYRMYAEYLKADGYATSSTYVNTLCRTVESYNLQIYDTGELPSQWQVGKTYTTQQDLNIRQEPNGDTVPFNQLTADGQKHAFISPSGSSVLRRGTRVTVKAIKSTGTSTWLQIPSGWICGKNSKNIYVI
jgi:hypothetical protein